MEKWVQLRVNCSYIMQLLILQNNKLDTTVSISIYHVGMQ